MNAPDRAAELTERYFADQLAPSELAELQRGLVDDPRAAESFVASAREDQLLREVFTRQRDSIRAAECLDETLAKARRGARRRVQRVAIAAVILLAVGIGLLWRAARPVAPPRLAHELLAGTILIGGTPSSEILDESELEVADLVPAVLRMSDGSRAEFAPLTRLTIHRADAVPHRVITLTLGSGRFHVERDGRDFRVETPVGNVTALGTEFTVELRPDAAPAPVEPDDSGTPAGPATRRPQLLVAVVSGRVAVDYDNETFALEMGDDRIYAANHAADNANPDFVGQVVDVATDNAGTTTITVEARKTAKLDPRIVSVRLTDRTRLSWINVPVDRQSPSLGFTAQLWRDPLDRDVALAARFTAPQDAGPPPRVTGRVIAVSDDGQLVTLESPRFRKHEPPQQHTIRVTPDTDMTYFFVPLIAEQPTLGYEATVWLTPGSSDRAARVHFAGDKRGRYQPDLQGRITSVSADGREIELLTQEPTGLPKKSTREVSRTIHITADTKLVTPNDPAHLRRLAPGDRAMIWLQPDSLNIAAGIRILTAEP